MAQDVVEALIATRGRALTGYAYLLCGDITDAEDLVQDALVKTFSRRRAGLALASAEGYVRQAILTTYVDGWRRRGRWATRLHLVAEASSVDGPEAGTATRVDVVAALRHLPRQQRACVVLRFYEDLTVSEIADALGISDGSVKRYLSMGVRTLEGLLGPLAGTTTTIEIVQETRS
jgi:RNA polymerase sigma-70 factor (sigma-E family)